MLTKHYASDQPSKNPSTHKLNFPYLSHKVSESHHREKTLDLAFLPFYADNQSATDCSSAGRFFKNPDFPKTTRAASHSYKMPKVHKPRESFLNHPEPRALLSSDQSWEVSERIESFKIRVENCPYPTQTSESLNFHLSMWKSCSSEVLSVIKSANNELHSSLSYLFSKYSILFDDLQTLQKTQTVKILENLEEMSSKVKKLQKELLKVQNENSELLSMKRLDQEMIKKEVEELFPNNDDEIKRLKEESLNLRRKEDKNVPETLEKLWNSMQIDEKIPELTEIDLEQFNSGQVLMNLQENYKFVISKTVKHVKQTAPKPSWSIKDVQTESVWVDPKFHEDLQKQLEKMHLSLQSCQMQLENFKEDSFAKTSAFEKFENEKQQLKNETLQVKRESEMIHKEIQNLKLDLDLKKSEILKVRRQNDEKTVVIVELEAKIDGLTEKLLDLSYELEKAKRSRPPSSFVVRKSERMVGKEKEKEKEKEDLETKVDKTTNETVGKTSNSIRDEMEKMFSNLGKGGKISKDLHDRNKDKSSSDGKNASFDHSKALENDDIVRKSTEKSSEVFKSSEFIKKSEDKNLDLNKAYLAENYLKPIESDKKNIEVEKKPEQTKPLKMESIKTNEKPQNNAKKSREKNQPEENEETEVKTQSKPVPKDSKPLKSSEFSKSEEKKPKNPVPKTIQKFQAVKTQITIAKKLGDLKKPSKICETFSSAVNSFDPVGEIQDSDSEETSNNPISTSKYNETSQKDPKGQNESTSSVQGNPSLAQSIEKDPHVIPKTFKASENQSSNEEFAGINSNIDDSLESEKKIRKSENSEKIQSKTLKQSEKTQNFDENSENSGKNFKENQNFEIDFKVNTKVNSSEDKTFKRYPNIVLTNQPILLENGKDECFGTDLIECISIGIQVNMNKRDDSFIGESATYFLPYNPNNIYGLRGDVYYQGSSFQPQARIPDLSSTLLFAPPYKLN